MAEFQLEAAANIGLRGSRGVIGEMGVGWGDDPGGEKEAYRIWHRLKSGEIRRFADCHNSLFDSHKGHFRLSQVPKSLSQPPFSIVTQKRAAPGGSDA